MTTLSAVIIGSVILVQITGHYTPSTSRPVVDCDVCEPLDRLVNTVTNLEKQGRQRDKQIATLLKDNSKLRNDIQLLKEKNGEEENTVAFTVAMLSGHFHLRDGSAVPFGKVTTNIGNHYKMEMNCFICPVNGLYSFSFSIHSGPLSNEGFATTVAELVVADSTVATAFCASVIDEGDVYLQCTQSVVVQCEEGEQVWIKSRGNRAQIAGDSEALSTFSGFLIKEM